MGTISAFNTDKKIDSEYLERAWANAGKETQYPLKDIMGYCMRNSSYFQIQEQLYHHYNPDLYTYRHFEDIDKDTRFVAFAMVNLLYNKKLAQETRKAVSNEIIKKLKPVIDTLKSPSNDQTVILNEELNINIPGNANDFFDALIFDTKNAMYDYKSMIDLSASLLNDQTIQPE